MTTTMTRRTFLKGSLAASGLTIVAYVTPFGTKLVNAAAAEGAVEGFKPSAFYQITPANIVKVMVPNSEMGQGVHTALPMIIADELEADWDQLEILQAPAAAEFKNPLLRNQLTVASASVRGFYWPLRKAGAASGKSAPSHHVAGVRARPKGQTGSDCRSGHLLQGCGQTRQGRLHARRGLENGLFPFGHGPQNSGRFG